MTGSGIRGHDYAFLWIPRRVGHSSGGSVSRRLMPLWLSVVLVVALVTVITVAIAFLINRLNDA